MKEFNSNTLKTVIKDWLIEIDKTDKLPTDIIALSFNLFEPFGLELVGSTWYDKEDEDWACEEAFIPTQRICPNFYVSENFGWEKVLEIVTQILKELVFELSSIKLLKVKHIAVGFVDGDLITIK